MTKIQVRRGTAAQWTSANPVLAAGEWGFETDTKKFKIGDGTTAWNAPLSYAVSGANSPFAGTVTLGSNIAGTATSGGASVSTFNGSVATTLNLPATIYVDVEGSLEGNAATATTLETARKINGTSFSGSAAIVVGGAIIGKAAPVADTTTFSNIYISSSAAGEPTAPNNGDVWISW